MSQSQIPLPPAPETGDKEAYWLGSALDDLSQFPAEVKDLVGFALRFAQRGKKHPSAEPLRGYGGAGVLEVIKSFDKDTYRAVYTVQFAKRIYVLHCFQKKSSSGIAIPRKDLDVINARLQQAEQIRRAWSEAEKE